MGKTCKDCGKNLGFFSIFSNVERCDECQKKFQFEYMKGKSESPADISQIQNPVTLSKSFCDSTEGHVEYYNLQDWWLNTLTADERNTLLTIYKPLGFSSDSLNHGKIKSSSQSVVSYLSNLSGWVKKPEYRKIGYKLIEKAEDSVSNRTPVVDRHFLYQAKLELYYRNREIDNFALPYAIEACKQQIALSTKAKQAFLNEFDELPSHKGYEQLCIIMEKQKKYDAVIRLANEAKSQGWAGDWDKRIEKCTKKKNV